MLFPSCNDGAETVRVQMPKSLKHTLMNAVWALLGKDFNGPNPQLLGQD